MSLAATFRATGNTPKRVAAQTEQDMVSINKSLETILTLRTRRGYPPKITKTGQIQFKT